HHGELEYGSPKKPALAEISIIKTSEKEKAAVNKDALNEAIKKPIDDKWTADSKRAAEEAKAAAEEIAANEYVTQEVVDLAGLVVFQQVLHGAVALGVPGFL
ncbi:hypothetical protein PZH31_17410, partial [[Ruminococcus] torques]|nr:hypothetical protein [[Ruminococcus] torques]